MARPNTKPLRVAVYIRVANIDQADCHYESLKQFYINHIGSIPNGTLADFYVDEASGSSRQRPALQRLLTDCQAGQIDQVMVKSLRILNRNITEALNFILAANRCGAAVCLEKEGLVV